MSITEVYIDFFVYTCYYIQIMETVTDFIADCRSFSAGTAFPDTIKTHDDLTRVLTSFQPQLNGHQTPLTSFGERVQKDLLKDFSFGYNGINVCSDAEITLLESLEDAQNDAPLSGQPEISGRRVTIFTLNDVPAAIQKNILARTAYGLSEAPDYNLVSHSIAKFASRNLVYPQSSPGTIFCVPLESLKGTFWFGRYATSAVSTAIREQLSADSMTTRKGLLLDHERVVALTNKLLDRSVLLDTTLE